MICYFYIYLFIHIPGHDYKVEDISFHNLTWKDITTVVLPGSIIDIKMTGGTVLGKVGRLEVKKSFVSTHCELKPFDLYGLSVEIQVIPT